jgi:hypothetical protein
MLLRVVLLAQQSMVQMVVRSDRRHRNLGQDVGVGAGASALTGVITGDRKDTLGNAVDGAAVGGAIHLLNK